MNKDDENQIQNLNDPREPFEEPTLECEELFETLALACGKIQPVFFRCQRSNRLS
jgi:hypothetical protein